MKQVAVSLMFNALQALVSSSFNTVILLIFQNFQGFFNEKAEHMIRKVKSDWQM